MKIVTKSDEQVIEEMIDRKVSGINQKLDDIISAKPNDIISAKPKENIVQNIVAKINEKIPKPEKPEEKKEEKHDHSISCPTCGGHVHKLAADGLNLKCTGDKCGQEFYLTPKPKNEEDYKNYFNCTACGNIIRQPDENNKFKVDDCPFCQNKKSMRIDWNQIKTNIVK